MVSHLCAFALGALLQKPFNPPKQPVQPVTVSELTAIRAELDAVSTNVGQWGKSLPVIEKGWAIVDKLIAEDRLQTGGDFYAASLVADDVMNFREHQQIAHELAITALLLDEPNAPMLVAKTWDRLMLSMGKQSRFGTMMEYDHDKQGPVPAKLDAGAVLFIGEILRDPVKAREKVKAAKDNQDILDLRAADQKDRSGDMAKQTQAEIAEWSKRDIQRQKRIMEILAAGGAHTAKDLEAAALVLQHSSKGEGHQLAHELCLASLALGSKEADWLVSRSYDRMLLNWGFKQRYGTNMNMFGLMPWDKGLNDRMRKLAVTKPIAEQIKQGEEWKKKVAGMTGG